MIVPIAVRCLYYKAVTPNFRILCLDEKNWRKWLWGNNSERIQIYEKIIGHTADIREITWIYLRLSEEQKQELISVLNSNVCKE